MDFMSTQGASSSSSPSSSTHRWKYDVFLSFRGKDTRYCFTDHLYNALKRNRTLTFRDDKNLETGKPISPELLKAIEESRFAIVILSKDYASSAWCLDELVEIVRCMKEKKMIVLPVFYHVNPSNVRDQRGTFEEAFAEHEAACNIQKVETWRAALREVANLCGWHVEERQYESKTIRQIVEHILHRLSSTFSSITKDLVGIDSSVKELITLYLGHWNSAYMTGICGMGGLGKTTLAGVIYETVRNHFEGSSFIAKVGEVSKNNGLKRLQKQLLEQILKERKIKIWDDYHGVSMIKDRLRHKKVLVVLDDVDELDQLEKLAGHGWFGLGSWIIITTRDEHLLDIHGIGENDRYKPSVLHVHDALKLFCLKAFKKEEPIEGYEQLSHNVVYYANGLPLALVILGSLLVGRTRDEWQSELEKLKKFPERKTFDILKVSYDRLDNMQRKIFLNIACFFNGEKKDRVIEILENCDFNAKIDIRVLIDKSLVTIENEKLWMHDLLQEMGREIVRRESPEEPGERSRLWLREDLFNVLKKDKATKAIRAIVLKSCVREEGYQNFEAFHEPFSKMCNLRLLIIHHVQIPNGLNHVPDDLRYLEWFSYSSRCLPSSFQPKELIGLNLRASQIKYLWEGRKCFPKLKCINLENSLLIQTPDFAGIPMLERLYLSGCINLVEIHPSIGQLRRLEVLELEGCITLTNLPSMTPEMQALKILNLCGCSNIRKIPEFKGIMKRLSELYLGMTAIEKLPSSIDCLIALTLLNLEHCENLECLPSNMDSLRSLKKLVLSGCLKLANLPENLGKINCLKELDLSGMSRHETPYGGLYGNKELESDFSMRFNGIGCLSSLEHLTLSRNNFATLPASISQLSKLETLDLSYCYKLQSLPDLPSTVRYINAQCCVLPKLILRGSQFPQSGESDESNGGVAFIILNRYLQEHLSPKTGNEISTKRKEAGYGTEFQIIYRGWFSRWLTYERLGNSIRIELPSNWCNSRVMGFALCAYLDKIKFRPEMVLCNIDREFDIPREVFSLRANVMALGDMPHSHYTSETFCRVTSRPGHIWLLYLSCESLFATVLKGECSQIEVEFESIGNCPYLKVQKCGVRLIYEQDVEDFNQKIAQYGTGHTSLNWGECSQIEVEFESIGNCPCLKVRKCGVRLIYEQDVEEFNQTIEQCDTSYNTIVATSLNRARRCQKRPTKQLHNATLATIR